MSEITRRQLLKRAAVLGASMGVPHRAWCGEPGGQGAGPRVVRVSGPVRPSLDRLLESLGGIGRFVRPGNVVLLKPNMSFPNPPEQATTTDPELVAGVIRHCLNAGAKKVLVADHPMRAVKLCVEMTGMERACRPFSDAVLIGADREGMYRDVTLQGTRQLKRTRVLRAALAADVMINLPRMKSHAATTVSMGTKGNMGLIWDRSSFHGTLDLNEAIGDLNTVLRADLTILDGSRVLTAGGPLGPGPVEELQCLIGGTDPVAVDAVGVLQCAWYGKRVLPEQVGHLAACARRGVGEIDPARMEIVDEKT